MSSCAAERALKDECVLRVVWCYYIHCHSPQTTVQGSRLDGKQHEQERVIAFLGLSFPPSSRTYLLRLRPNLIFSTFLDWHGHAIEQFFPTFAAHHLRADCGESCNDTTPTERQPDRCSLGNCLGNLASSSASKGFLCSLPEQVGRDEYIR